jgi:hypothetical protein
MTVYKNLMIAAVIVGLVLVSGTPATAQATWNLVPSPNVNVAYNTLHSVAGADPRQVWAVGEARDRPGSSVTRRSVILVFDGGTWRPAPGPTSPSNQRLTDVDARTVREVWAVGGAAVGDLGKSRTLIYRWDGSWWRPEASPSPDPDGRNLLAAVRAVPGQPGSVWAVGQHSRPGPGFGNNNLILRRTEGSWQAVPSPSPFSDNSLAAVDATGPADVWAVGTAFVHPLGGPSQAVIQHWDGASWQAMPVLPVILAAQAGIPTMLNGVAALAPNDVWAVGGIIESGGSRPFVLHYDGVSWTRATVPALEVRTSLTDVVALSPTNIYAVGLDVILHYDGASWTRERIPPADSRQQLNAVAAVGRGTVWAVGSRISPTANLERTLTLRTTNG